MNIKAQAQSNAKKPADRRILAQAEREEHTGPASGTRAHVEAWEANRRAFNSQQLTLTLAEACDLVGRDLEPTSFQTQVFDVLARELDVLSKLGENEGGFDGWCAFQNLRSRVELAGKIAAVIGGAS